MCTTMSIDILLVYASPYTRFKFSNNCRLYRDTMPSYLYNPNWVLAWRMVCSPVYTHVQGKCTADSV